MGSVLNGTGLRLLAHFVLGLLLGLGAGGWKPAVAGPRNAEDLLIVDCLLPGQVRKLGRMGTYLTARRPVRTTQADCEIRGGEYIAYDRANYQTALRFWMERAEAGDAEAQNYVGEIYQKGLGTAPDFAKAAEWYGRAVAQGFKRAMVNLGFLYENGLGVERDLAKALNLYRQASGLPADRDDLVFASSVQVSAAVEAELSALKASLAHEREQSAALRGEVERLRQALDAQRRAVEEAERERRDLQRRLERQRESLASASPELVSLTESLEREKRNWAAARAALEAERRQTAARDAELRARLAAVEERERALAPADGGAEGERRAVAAELLALREELLRVAQTAEALNARLQESERRLAEERRRYEDELARLERQAAERREDWELMRLLENQLVAKDQQLRRQKQELAELERRLAAARPAPPAMAQVALTRPMGPVVEVIEPALTLTRGRMAAVLRGAGGEVEIVGRVSSDAEVAAVELNGETLRLSPQGGFRHRVKLRERETPVSIAATDVEGRIARLEFVLFPATRDEGESARAQSEATSGPRALPRGLDLGRFHALIIGNDQYQSYPPLRSARNDARALAELLRKRYGYEVRLLLDADRFTMLSAMNELREKLGKDDNLLIYFAGHGELDPIGRQGYWLPVDARPELPLTWISNTAVSDFLNTMNARHVLVVADSCYSGAMTRSAVPSFAGQPRGSAWSDWVRAMVAGRSRLALTSGGLQPVPDTGRGDHSYFARALLAALEDNNGLLDAQTLFRQVSVSLGLLVAETPLVQVPEFAPIQFAGHESGMFFFLPRARSGASASGL